MSSPLILSKSKFKPQALEYLRMVEKTKKPIVITNFGQPSVKIIPYIPEVDKTLAELKGRVLSYQNPFEPVGLDDWENLP
ncbi:MAG: type II toxin-antitoxin system prevent-host-death family antitoxin [Patescibacteria group bacterium]|nr:type II toxin-antitoxin system Phd/YefM family antitoxin [Patescibacteria group bacterium]